MSESKGATNTATVRPMKEPEPKFPPQKQPPPGSESELRPQPKWKAERYQSAGKLKGQAALITGGDSGIGRSVAYLYAREGADVAITCLPEEQPDAETICDAIEKLGRRCIVIPGDLSQRGFCDHVIETTLSEFGRLDVLVHNAAWQNRKDVIDLDDDELDMTLKSNLYSYIRLVRAAVPQMKPGASIIATGSVVGIHGSSRLVDYAATKGGIHAVTMSLAQELLARKIRVNCVAPGPVWTPLNVSDRGLTAEEVSGFGADTGPSPMKRPAQPEEISPAFVFLASEADSSYVNGVVLPITGGPA